MSRLLDLCRQSIVFDSAADVAACIRAVRKDSDAHVVRIKNKLDPAFDACPYGGYRDVAVNLRLSTPAAVRFGLESHICELQLLLRPYAEFKVKKSFFNLHPHHRHWCYLPIQANIFSSMP